MSRGHSVVGILLFMTLMSARGVSAQVSCTSGTGGSAGSPSSCTSPGTTLTATMNVVRVGELTINTASTAVTPDEPAYSASETGLGSLFGGPTFTVRSNSTYNVSITYGATFTSPNSKPATDVAIQASPGSCNPTGNDAGYIALTGGGATTAIVTGASATAGTSRQLCVKVRWFWTADGPGSYTLPLTFSMTAP
jgi:hypothetical protein